MKKEIAVLALNIIPKAKTINSVLTLDLESDISAYNWSKKQGKSI